MTKSVIHFLALITVTGLLTSPLKAQEPSAPSNSSPIKTTSNDQDKDQDKDQEKDQEKEDYDEKENYDEKKEEKEWDIFDEKDCYKNYYNYHENDDDKDGHHDDDKDCHNKVPEGGASIALLGLALAGLGAAHRLTQKA
jgi:hypothetical protein